MSITIGTVEFSRLTAQPFGYDESDVRTGLTARKWSVSGLLTGLEWLELLDVYNAWRDSRIQDEDSLVSGGVGSVVTLSGTGFGGETWTNVQCWFSSAPQAEQSGVWVSATVELIDANQALAVLQSGQEQETVEDLPDFGTITLGTTVVTLIKPPDSYGEGPSMELTPGGQHYISGPLAVYKIKDVEGTTDLAGWNNIRTWYEQQIVAYPLTGSYFPISIPSATAENKIISGIKRTVYTVSIQLGLVI